MEPVWIRPGGAGRIRPARPAPVRASVASATGASAACFLGHRSLGGRGGGLGGLLLLQGRGEPRDLRGELVEHDGSLGERALHGAGQLGQQNLAGLQVGELADLGRAERLAVHQPALDHQQRVGLGEITQRLRGIDGLTVDERHRRRTDEQLVHTLHTGVRGSPLDQGVLGDGVRGVGAQGPPQLGELRHLQAAVLGDDGCRRGPELVGDLGDRARPLRSWPSAPPSSIERPGGSCRRVLRRPDRGRTCETPRRRRTGRGSRPSRRPDLTSSSCVGRPGVSGTFIRTSRLGTRESRRSSVDRDQCYRIGRSALTTTPAC